LQAVNITATEHKHFYTPLKSTIIGNWKQKLFLAWLYHLLCYVYTHYSEK